MRKCTTHRGGFALVGTRVTVQASGSLCFMAGNSVNNMYFRMDTDRKLLPQVESLTNSLHKEDLQSGYSCGNIYTFTSVKVLGLKDIIDFCNRSIFTPHNFCNTKHFDYNFLSKSVNDLVFNDPKVTK